MRILFWSEQFWPQIGGIEVWGTRILQALRDRGHEYAVIASRDNLAWPSEDLYEGIPVYRFPFRTALANRDVGQLAEITRAIANIKRAVEPDLVHLNLTGPSVYFHVQTHDALGVPAAGVFASSGFRERSGKASQLFDAQMAPVA